MEYFALGNQEIIGILLTLTAIASYISYRFVNLPKSIGITLVVLVLTLVIGTCGRLGWDLSNFTKDFLIAVDFNATFVNGMLGFLLFAGAIHVNKSELSKYKTLVALLATISVVISTVLIAYATKGLAILLNVDLPLTYCFVFGALISPTDPIATLGIFKSIKLGKFENLHIPKPLELKIKGEALFNDGMGVVIFFVTLTIATGTQNSVLLSDVIIQISTQVLGGLGLGTLLGMGAGYILRSIDTHKGRKERNEHEVAILLTLAIVTGGYTLAHSVLHVSGPIAMAVAGLIIGNVLDDVKQAMKHQLYEFWDLLDEVLSAILFVLIGLELMATTFTPSVSIIALGAIVITLVARWMSIAIPVAALGRFKQFSRDVLLVMTWAGLRGGISIALALSIDSTSEYRDPVLAITYAVVLFSMVVQGMTIVPLLRHVTTRLQKAYSHKCKSPLPQTDV